MSEVNLLPLIHACYYPTYQGIMGILRRLGHKNPAGFGWGPHKMVRAHIGHDLCARIDGRTQLLLEARVGSSAEMKLSWEWPSLLMKSLSRTNH